MISRVPTRPLMIRGNGLDDREERDALMNCLPERDLPEVDLVAVTATDGDALLAAAKADWSRPIVHCPGWDAAALVAHVGGVLSWMARIVLTGEPVDRRDRETPPAPEAELADWYSRHLDRTIDVLTTASPDVSTWTFSSRGDRRVAWWRRRLAVELAIHRWDIQHAAHLSGGDPPVAVDSLVSAVGIEEFVTEFLPGLLAQPEADGVRGTLHLHAVNGPSEWWIDLDGRGRAVPVAEHRTADTAVHGIESDLLLWLTNRAPTPSINIVGEQGIVDDWARLRR